MIVFKVTYIIEWKIYKFFWFNIFIQPTKRDCFYVIVLLKNCLKYFSNTV